VIALETLKASHLSGIAHSSVTDKRQRKDALTDPPFLSNIPTDGARTPATRL
jgi:hypothetical protein